MKNFFSDLFYAMGHSDNMKTRIAYIAMFAVLIISVLGLLGGGFGIIYVFVKSGNFAITSAIPVAVSLICLIVDIIFLRKCHQG